MNHLFSEKKIKSVIKDAFEATIMRGNYYSLELAAQPVQNCDFSQKKKEVMTAALKYINENGNVNKTRRYLVKNQIICLDFNESLQDLVNIGVNPITIPDEYNLDFIPGLLETCENLVYETAMSKVKP